MKLPQFNLRDLFWLVLVCALAVGWWADRSRLGRKVFGLEWEAAVHEQSIGVLRLWREDIEAEIERLGYETKFQDDKDGRAHRILVPKDN